MRRAWGVGVMGLMFACTSHTPAEQARQQPAESRDEPGGDPTRISCGIERPGPPLTISQGIAGVVCYWRGDFMPSPDGATGTIRPVQRTIEVHAATRDADVKRKADMTYIDSVATPRIATIQSRDDGWFEVSLPPGTYSLFVHEPNGLYANRWNDEGIIFPVVVEAGAVARVQFDITHESVE